MDDRTKLIEMVLDDNTVLAVRAVELGGPADVGVLDAKALKSVTKAIEEVGAAVKDSIAKVAPGSASVAFGIEVAVSGNALVALLTGVNGKATMTVTLNWGGDG